MKENTSKHISCCYLTFLILLMVVGQSNAQSSYNVLFLGNSYTGFNNLPQLTSDLALSAGDTLIFDSNTPGGYRLANHYQNNTSLGKLQLGNWDYVVLQEQSQNPILSNAQFEIGATNLHAYTRQYNPCTVMMPYITWGRKNGDASNCPNNPVMCTYEGMDTTLRNAYLDLADNLLHGEVSPVSVVWSYIRQNHPMIELYAGDGSHPSLAGSYAAACCFYAAIFKKDPTLITNDYGLNPVYAQEIRNAAKIQVFDQLSLWDFKKPPYAEIQYTIGTGANTINFNAKNPNQLVQDYAWDFGDGNTSTVQNPTHTYATAGTFLVELTTYSCNLQGWDSMRVDTVVQLCQHTPTIYAPNQRICPEDTLWTQAADGYQWYLAATLLPGEDKQYLSIQYPQSANQQYSVQTTVNGCSEFSAPFYVPFQSDLFNFYHNYGSNTWIPDPCQGDTAVLHVVRADFSPLHGLETIHWFRDGVLLPQMNNKDTLLITTGGAYRGLIADMTATCPTDTLFSFTVTYNCGTSSVLDADLLPSVKLYPNPATDALFLEFDELPDGVQYLSIYSIYGSLVKEFRTSTVLTQLDIAELQAGVYFILLEGQSSGLRFVKW